MNEYINFVAWTWIVVGACFLTFAFLGAFVARIKGRSMLAGAIVGAAFWIVGLAILSLLPRKRRRMRMIGRFRIIPHRHF